jgi:hypothetical protein
MKNSSCTTKKEKKALFSHHLHFFFANDDISQHKFNIAGYRNLLIQGLLKRSEREGEDDGFVTDTTNGRLFRRLCQNNRDA